MKPTLPVRYKLVRRPDKKHMDIEEVGWRECYVWDHVTVALHVGEQVPSLIHLTLNRTESFHVRKEIYLLNHGSAVTIKGLRSS